LGLSTVSSFIEHSRGVMALDSMLGRGTTVSLFLPQHRAAEFGRRLTRPAPDVPVDGARANGDQWWLSDSTTVTVVEPMARLKPGGASGS